jgi:cell division protein FtsZ
MSINLSIPTPEQDQELKPRLTVMGVGVNNMIASELEGVEFVVANTDAQALGHSSSQTAIQLGVGLTQGLGAGSRPEVGRAAAEESLEEIMEHIGGSHMLFLAAGMGGGTGTGAAPIIAKTARENGILTVGVVTKPFHFEGVHRMRLADAGIEELEQYVDTLIIIPNQNLFRVVNEKTTFADAFSMADRVLYSGVRGVTDLMVMPGLINLDFADVRSVMSEMGKAMMGTGEAEGETRAIEAAEAAISNPLLDDSSMKGAKGMLINITGGMDMTLFEVDEAAERIRKEVDSEAYIIFGSTFDESMDGKMRVSVVATGIDAGMVKQPLPEMVRLANATQQPQQKAIPAAPAEAKPMPALHPAAKEQAAQQVAPAESVKIVAQKPEPKPEAAPAAPPSAKAPAEDWDPVVVTHATGKPKSVTVSIKPAPKPAPKVAVAITASPAPVSKSAKPEVALTQAPTAEQLPATAPAPASRPRPRPRPRLTPKPMPAAAFSPEMAPEDKKPAAMPSANASDPFIPPAPVERETGEMQKSPDPFAVAAMANGAQKNETQEAAADIAAADPLLDVEATDALEAPKKKGPSLFERVTGTGRARDLDEGSAEMATVTPHPAVEFATESTSESNGETTNESAENSKIQEEEPQRELGGLSPNDRLISAPEDEDLLDIPAFLRRQAN